MSNFITLSGHVGWRDEQVKTTENNFKIFKFTVAESVYAGRNEVGEGIYKTQWHTVAVFGNYADFIEQRLKKGALVSVNGTLKINVVEKEGQKKTYVSVSASEVVIPANPEGKQTGTEVPAANGSDLPF